MDQMKVVREYWSMFLRRFWIIAIIGGIGISLSVAYAMLKRPVYEAEAKILVESPQIPEDMARSIVSGDAAERLQLIQQRLMTRNNLANLIQKFSLFTDRTDLTLTDKVGRLRKATRILPISLNRRGYRPSGNSISAFTIKVTLNDAGKAAQVANEFVTMVLDQNLRVRREGAQGTLSFFSEEAKRLRQELSALELEISTFKNENKHSLPINLTFNQEQLSRLEDIDREVDQEILRLEEERSAIEAAIVMGRTAPGLVISSAEQELQRLQAELARQRAVYADSHRIIRDLKAQIAAVEEQTQQTPNPSADEKAEEVEDPRVAELQRQIDARSRQIALQQDYQKELARKRENLVIYLQRTPSVEIELNRLNRKHMEKQEMLAEINNKRITAETGERLEDTQQSERFEVIENAIRPNKPISPNRPKIIIMGGSGSLGLAFGLVFLLEMLFPRIRTPAQLERKLQLKAVVAIPYVRTRREKRQRFMSRAAGVAIILMALPAVMFAVDQYYLPLPLVIERIAEKSGIDAILKMVEHRL